MYAQIAGIRDVGYLGRVSKNVFTDPDANELSEHEARSSYLDAVKRPAAEVVRKAEGVHLEQMKGHIEA